jgi:hypothetical protein
MGWSLLRLGCHGGHAPAGLRTPPTLFRTFRHHLVVSEILAARCTGITDIGTDSADVWVHTGTPQHETGARRANLGTIKKHSNVVGLCVPAAATQAVRHTFGADISTRIAFVNAAAHFGR